MKRLPSVVALSIVACAVGAQEPDEGIGTPQMREMRATMQHMHEQMARIHATDDPAERERLMREHMESMHQGMMMMGGMMHGGPAGSADGATTCAEHDMQCQIRGMQQQQELTAERMEMMHGMLRQMMEHMMQEHGSAAGQSSEPPGADTEVQPENPEQHEEHH